MFSFLAFISVKTRKRKQAKKSFFDSNFKFHQHQRLEIINCNREELRGESKQQLGGISFEVKISNRVTSTFRKPQKKKKNFVLQFTAKRNVCLDSTATVFDFIFTLSVFAFHLYYHFYLLASLVRRTTSSDTIETLLRFIISLSGCAFKWR